MSTSNGVMLLLRHGELKSATYTLTDYTDKENSKKISLDFERLLEYCHYFLNKTITLKRP